MFILDGIFRSKNSGFTDFELTDFKLMRFTAYVYELNLVNIIL
jgi:hypothetical protein